MTFLVPLLAGCSSSLGASGTYSVTPARFVSAGLHTGSLVELPVLLSENTHFAIGSEVELLQRADDDDGWGQWRFRPLLGFTNMPKSHESAFGFEAFLSPGVARYYSDERINVAFAPGLLFGMPVRLDPSEPPWRTDDLVALHHYFVPALGTTWLGFDRLEINVTLQYRIELWSAMLP